MKTLKKSLCARLAALMLAASLTACGGGAKEVNTKTGSFDDMVAYLTEKGYIAKDATPVDINATEGYVTDNTGGQMPFATVADKAQDFGGLWLFWWDTANPTDNYSTYESMAANGGTIVIMGGAAILQPAGTSGSFAIGFAEDYAQKDAALADFNALPKE